jgi:hypothetical protein
MMRGWKTLNNQNRGNGNIIRIDYVERVKFVGTKVVINVNRKKKFNSLQTLKFCNVDLVFLSPSPTIYG